MMSSKRPSDPADLHFDVPTTAKDVEWLRKVRTMGVPTFAEHLRFLSGLPTDLEALRRRELPIGYEPFKLD